MPLGATSTPIPPVPATSAWLPVPYHAQTETEWCWAAVAFMIFAFYAKAGHTQCALADFLFGLTTCCGTPSGPSCNKPCPRSDFVKVLGHGGLGAVYQSTSVSFGTIQAEINAGRPVPVTFLYTPAGAPACRHLVVVHGWSSGASGHDVLVSDPNAGLGVMTFSHLVSASGLGAWDATWTNVA